MTDRKLEILQMEGVEVRKTCCYFCHHNCGVLAYVKDGELLYAEGDPSTANAGGLCARGNQAMTFYDSPTRINYPLKRAGEKGENKWERVSWDQALTEIAEKINTIKAESGPEAVAAIAGTLRTDDWARRRFFNVFGSPNVCHNSLLCWVPTFMIETAVAGWSPFETDLGGSKCVILWGFNPGAANLPAAHGYFDLQKQTGMKIIVVDPRYTETAAHADLWLPLRPGSDTALALAMINVIINEFLYNMDFVDNWCEGFDELMDYIDPYDPEWAAEKTWLDPELIRQAARMYATNTPGNIQWGCTWDQLGKTSGAGTHARQILRAITGNLDVPGGDGMPGPAAYVTDEELEHNEALPEDVKSKQLGADKFPLTTFPGYTRLAEISKEKWGKAFTAEWMCEAHGPSIFKAILTGVPYKVRAMFVSGSNPLSSWGDSKMVYAATKAVEFLVVLEYAMTPTALQADFVLPVAGAIERPVIHTNYGVTDSIVCHQRGVEPAYERKTDYNIWRDLGIACGQDVEKYWPNERLEDEFFDVLKPLGLPIESYDDFVERFRMYYPPLQQAKHLKRGYFCTASGKVELKSSVMMELGLPGLPVYLEPPENEVEMPEVAEEFPLVLTTGGGFMPYCHSEHFNNPIIRYIKPEPHFTIHPDTAAKLGIEKNDWCWIETRRGRIKQRANVEPNLDPRVIYTERGWWFPERSHEGYQPFGCLESNTNVLTSVDDEDCCPMTGCWSNRGLLCKVYKCTEADHIFTYDDSKFSIPGNRREPGIDWEYVKNPPRALPLNEPVFPQPDFEVPEGATWDYKSRKAWDALGHYVDPASGWGIDPARPGEFFQIGTGYKFLEANGIQYLLDEASGQYYDFSLNPVEAPGAPFEVPSSCVWDGAQQKAIVPGTDWYYDPESGWVIDPATGVYYEAYTLRAYDPTKNVLIDMQTGKYYSMQDPNQEVDEAGNPIAGAPAAGAADPGFEVPPTCTYDPATGWAYVNGTDWYYDPESGWCIDPATNVYYEPYTLRAYDAEKNCLVDMETGRLYSIADPAQEIDEAGNPIASAEPVAAEAAAPVEEGESSGVFTTHEASVDDVTVPYSVLPKRGRNARPVAEGIATGVALPSNDAKALDREVKKPVYERAAIPQVELAHREELAINVPEDKSEAAEAAAPKGDGISFPYMPPMNRGRNGRSAADGLATAATLPSNDAKALDREVKKPVYERAAIPQVDLAVRPALNAQIMEESVPYMPPANRGRNARPAADGLASGVALPSNDAKVLDREVKQPVYERAAIPQVDIAKREEMSINAPAATERTKTRAAGAEEVSFPYMPPAKRGRNGRSAAEGFASGVALPANKASELDRKVMKPVYERAAIPQVELAHREEPVINVPDSPLATEAAAGTTTVFETVSEEVITYENKAASIDEVTVPYSVLPKRGRNARPVADGLASGVALPANDAKALDREVKKPVYERAAIPQVDLAVRPALNAQIMEESVPYMPPAKRGRDSRPVADGLASGVALPANDAKALDREVKQPVYERAAIPQVDIAKREEPMVNVPVAVTTVVTKQVAHEVAAGAQVAAPAYELRAASIDEVTVPYSVLPKRGRNARPVADGLASGVALPANDAKALDREVKKPVYERAAIPQVDLAVRPALNAQIMEESVPYMPPAKRGRDSRPVADGLASGVALPANDAKALDREVKQPVYERAAIPQVQIAHREEPTVNVPVAVTGSAAGAVASIAIGDGGLITKPMSLDEVTVPYSVLPKRGRNARPVADGLASGVALPANDAKALDREVKKPVYERAAIPQVDLAVRPALNAQIMEESVPYMPPANRGRNGRPAADGLASGAALPSNSASELDREVKQPVYERAAIPQVQIAHREEPVIVYTAVKGEEA